MLTGTEIEMLAANGMFVIHLHDEVTTGSMRHIQGGTKHLETIVMPETTTAHLTSNLPQTSP